MVRAADSLNGSESLLYTHLIERMATIKCVAWKTCESVADSSDKQTKNTGGKHYCEADSVVARRLY